MGKTDRIIVVYRWSEPDRHFTTLWKCQLPGQIGSLSVYGAALAVSQPGATLMLVDGKTGEATHATFAAPMSAWGSSVQGAATEVVSQVRGPGHGAGGGAESARAHSELLAICTTAGLLTLGTTANTVWELQIDRQLFALGKMQFSDHDSDSIVVCAWDGFTCIVNHAGNVVKFDLGQEVCAFLVGNYAVRPGENVPCLIYVTLTESDINPSKILVYYDLNLGTNMTLGSLAAPALLRQRNRDALARQGLGRGGDAATLKHLVRSYAELRAEYTAKQQQQQQHEPDREVTHAPRDPVGTDSHVAS